MVISVITPVFNGEKFIESCIQNVIEQNNSLVEHIIIDAVSTDKTVEIIRHYADKYPHIKWVSEKDEGQSDAMNKGIKMARGEIIGVLNVDDFYESDVLNRVQDILEQQPNPTFLVGNCNLWNDDEEIFHINKPKDLRLLALLSGRSCLPFNPSAYFYHKSLHEKIGLYKVDEHYGMDTDFIIKAVKSANITYMDEIWGNYRYIAGTKTFESVQSGHHYQIVNNIFQEHKQSLSSWQILQIHFLIFRNRVEFYLKHHSLFLPMLKTKIKFLMGHK
ncbi:MAG: glycosyltransferase [Scytonematopsis contorta HA4267-MV1]|jgi:glycosyltransferase involved in cell wall biosynthesis|nr:glycosyltransferase [Scytonematopsis contorta HA4267-MV1]